jgi:hypothetical protein
VNFSGNLYKNNTLAVFSNWTNPGATTTSDIYRNGRVGINMNTTPGYALDVNGDINIASGNTLRIGGNPAVFSKWSDATGPSGAIFRPNQVAVGSNISGPMTMTHQLEIFDDNTTATIGINQQGNGMGDLKIQYVNTPPAPNTSGYYTYAVYAP